MYSSSPYYDCYGNFEELLRQEFRKQGIEPVFNKFYLDFNTVDPKEGIKNMEAYLEIIKDKPVALILTVATKLYLPYLTPVTACFPLSL